MKRNPNGYGSVCKLSGGRSKPYAAYMPRTIRSGRSRGECIGYFETETEARIALAEWNKRRGEKINHSVSDIYDEWSAEFFKTANNSAKQSYKAAFSKLQPIHRMKMRNLRSGHIQNIINEHAEKGMSESSLQNIKIVASFLFKYAMEYDILTQNYAQFLKVLKTEKTEREIFTEDHVRIIEREAEEGDRFARLIMIMLYSGWRVGEFIELTRESFDPENKTLTGGKKTEAGKNRTVPVHPKVQSYVDECLSDRGPMLFCQYKDGQLRAWSVVAFRREFVRMTDKWGIKQSDGSPFTPHVCRHTFATMARKGEADPLVVKKLLGHSPTADVTEKVYTHVDVNMLTEAVKKLRRL